MRLLCFFAAIPDFCNYLRALSIQGCIKLLRSMRPGRVPISFLETNPGGLAAGSRCSARGNGADHRVNADKASCTQKGCQPVFDLTRRGAGVTSQRAVLASLQDARISSPRVRGSFALLARNDPRLPATNPAGLDWSAESNGKTSRKPAPTGTHPSLMQPCWLDVRNSVGLTLFRKRVVWPNIILNTVGCHD